MIREVTIRGFKKFGKITFKLPPSGNVVIAGPNNTGKTTLLQAIAAWGLALNQWKGLNNFDKRARMKCLYLEKPISRQAFSAVPLSQFDLLWRNRIYDLKHSIDIKVQSDDGTVEMGFKPNSTEQIFVMPSSDTDPEALKCVNPNMVFVPPMTGLGTEEPVYTPAKIEHVLGQSKPGDVLRNLLVQAAESQTVWEQLSESIKRLFGYEIHKPDSTGAHILAEYSHKPKGTKFDIASAGSGFQQVLMLLTFLNVRPGAVLLLDEPDAHLHVILQDAIFTELSSVAARRKSQLIIATHSDVIIESVEPRNLCAMLHEPRLIANNDEKNNLLRSLKALSNLDIMTSLDAKGVLYVEDYTDRDILRELAKVLNHPVHELLAKNLFWKKTVIQQREGTPGIQSKEHYDALLLVRDDIPGLMLVDGDAHEGLQTSLDGGGLKRLRWNRYEIESYLFHPDAIERFVETIAGGDTASRMSNLRKHFREKYPPGFLENPHDDELPGIWKEKARTKLIPPALAAAGLTEADVPYTRYHEIAAVMKPEEIHPEVKEKLDAIVRIFGG